MNQGESSSIAIDANAKAQIAVLVEQKLRLLLQVIGSARGSTAGGKAVYVSLQTKPANGE